MSELEKNNDFNPNDTLFENDTPMQEAEPENTDFDNQSAQQEAEFAPVKAEPYVPVNSYTYQNEPSVDTQAEPEPMAYTPPSSYYIKNSAQQSVSNNKASKKTKKTNKGEFSFSTLIICMIVTALISTIVSAVIVTKSDQSNSNVLAELIGSQAVGNADITITDDSTNYVEAVAAKVRPSVVAVTTRYVIAPNDMFGGNSNGVESEGTGVIYSSDGYIITNKHVVDYAIKYGGGVEVYLPENVSKAIPAEVVGYDSTYDLAVLKIDQTGLSAISIGSSSKLSVGQRVVAIGNPGGLNFMGSVSVGYISGLDRSITIDSFQMSLIQTDAAINPGNSGGALVDSEGKLVGITNSKIVSEQFEGMGFAIPVDTVVDLCNDIITNRNEPKPYIGVEINTSYTAGYLQSIGMPEGLVVASVIEGGPAAKAGLQKNDIIIAADGVEVTTYDKLVSIIRKHKIGEEITLKIYRNQRYTEVKIKTTASNG